MTRKHSAMKTKVLADGVSLRWLCIRLIISKKHVCKTGWWWHQSKTTGPLESHSFLCETSCFSLNEKLMSPPKFCYVFLLCPSKGWTRWILDSFIWAVMQTEEQPWEQWVKEAGINTPHVNFTAQNKTSPWLKNKPSAQPARTAFKCQPISKWEVEKNTINQKGAHS